MQQLVHKNINHKGSTLLLLALWGLFSFLTFSCSASADKDGDEQKTSDTLLLHEVKAMGDCRMKSANRDFYLHKYKAEKLFNKLPDDIGSLSEKEQRDIIYAKSEYAFQLTDYLLQTGQYKEAQDVMRELSSDATFNLHTDTLQWLNYLYHQGKVEFMPVNVAEHKAQLIHGYDCLIECYMSATKQQILKYKALSMQQLSRYFLNREILNIIKEYDAASMRYVNEDGVADTLLAVSMAERATDVFLTLKDEYLLADSWRNLARCYFDGQQYEDAITCLNAALDNPVTLTVPDLRANISEQLSMCYAALDDKHLSDLYRNEYLDLQDSTRQDRMLEARAMELEESTNRIWILAASAFAVFVFLVIVTFVLRSMRNRKMRKNDLFKEAMEEKEEELNMLRLQYSNAQRSAVEQRARIAIIQGMLPLIDRMKNSTAAASSDSCTEEQRENCLTYAAELSEAIDRQNAMVTQWIKMRQGSIAPKIETVPVQDVFDVVMKSVTVLKRSNITLQVNPTEASVKADRVLTLFLVNTLIDNARKATPEGGTITLSCEENFDARYAEISVSDTGKGMTEEQCRSIGMAELKTKNGDELVATKGGGYGFGLVNCRGIINRYRKISSLFSICDFNAESTLGKGTTIRFRLPLVLKTLVLLFCLMFTNAIHAQSDADRLADSLYACNVDGRYADAMVFADSLQQLVKQDSTISVDIRLSMYNETAVAALALHQWKKYQANNYLYNKLYKEATTDDTLAEYCNTMERNKLFANITMAVMIVLIISLVPIFWFVYLRRILRYRANMNRQKGEMDEAIRLVRKEHDRLHIINNVMDNQLSSLKHETMYYPSRISRLVESGANAEDIYSTVAYYRELYALLAVNAMDSQMKSYSFSVRSCKMVDVIPSLDVDDDIRVLANEELMNYLVILLKRHNGGVMPKAVMSEERSGDCHSVDFLMDQSGITEQQILQLFSPDTHHADFLTMRQILRETGASAHRYATGIHAHYDNQQPIITISLPKA